LFNATAEPAGRMAVKGRPFSTKLVPTGAYNALNVVVVMDGKNVTAECYRKDGTIFIENVTGNIFITAWGKKTTHTHEYSKVVTAPTSTEKGYTTYTCACGDSYIDDYINPVGPKPGVRLVGDVDGSGEVDYVDAMLILQYHTGVASEDALDLNCCDVDGSGEVDYVDAMLILQYHTGVIEKLPAGSNHNEVILPGKAATCTEDGLTEGKKCSTCGETIVAQTKIDKLGHTVVIDAAVAPTCCESGRTEGSHCATCNIILIPQQIIDATGEHTFVDGKCVVCQQNGHDWQDATCDNPKTCKACGLTDGNANGHDFEKLFSTDGYNIGSKVIRKCKKCGFVEMYTVGVYDHIIEDTLPNSNGEKVRVILLGGQSNASGCSHDAYLKKNVSPEKYAEYDNGYENIYINYFVSGSYKSNGFVKCATRQGEFGNCFGPELGLAEKLNELYPDETIFIIKYAWGGTNLFEQWLSPSSSVVPGVLYNQFVVFAEQSIQYLVSKGYQVEVEGMCWMQGESDSFSIENAVDYKVHLSNFIKDIRSQFSPYASPDGIAFVDACIADNPIYWVYCDLVNESKQAVVKESPMNALIDTNAHGLTCNLEPKDQPDIPHYDSLSQIRLGNLFALEIAKFFE